MRICLFLLNARGSDAPHKAVFQSRSGWSNEWFSGSPTLVHWPQRHFTLLESRLFWELRGCAGNYAFWMGIDYSITSLPLYLYGLSIITISLCIMPNHHHHHHHHRFNCWALTPSLMLHHHHHHHYELCMINTVRLWIMHLNHNNHQLIVLCINLDEHHHHHLCFIFVIMFHFCEDMTEISF